MTDIFKDNKPVFTSHFLKRYAERMFHVDENHADSWIKAHRHKFYNDLFTRLNMSEVYDYKNTKYNYLDKKYGPDVRLLKTGKFFFVIREFKNIVTFIREEELL